MTGVPQNNTVLAVDFRDCIECLNAHGVVFVLVGGYAVGWHGVVRATGDIDFLYEQTPRNVARLCDALREFGAPERFIDPAFLLSREAVTQIGHEPLRIDLLAAISGVTFGAVLRGAELIDLEDQHVLVIGLKELRANKAASGRPKDRMDLRRLGSAPAVPARAKSVAPAKKRSTRGKKR